jgi:hypothetical protein
VAEYMVPSVVDLGAVHELTLSNIHKNGSTGDVIVIAGVSTPEGGSDRILSIS